MITSPVVNTVVVVTSTTTYHFPYLPSCAALTSGFLKVADNKLTGAERFRVINLLDDIVKFNAGSITSKDSVLGDIIITLKYVKL